MATGWLQGEMTMRNRRKMKNSSRDRKIALRMLAVLMVVFLLSGCGARTGADSSDTGLPSVQSSEVRATATGLLSFSELSEI